MNKSVNKSIFIQAGLLAGLLSVHCITGVGDDYWNDYYRKKNEEKRKINNLTGKIYCRSLENCLLGCYKENGRGYKHGAPYVQDSAYTVHVRTCEKNCRDAILCDGKSLKLEEIK